MNDFAEKLPIDEVLNELIKAMREKNHAVLQAPPGAGKTTRIPIALLASDLFEKKIIMLQPRRLAVRSAAKRLAQHYGDQLGQTVGYRMRGESKVSNKTRIEVVTEGVLIKMIQNDPELNNVSCIIFDEFHERSLSADLGLTFCLEIRSELREDLGILVMSATLDAAPVAKLMGDAPVITSSGKSYDVCPYYLSKPWKFNKTFKNDFIQAISGLIIKAFEENEGSILAFLPGAREIKQVQTFLKAKLANDLDIYPLYGAMSFDEQQKAILPSCRRKLILATSIAETSLTIKDIRIVIDSGLTRRSRFDPSSGMSRLITERVTKAEAIQRMGRAGRTNTGVCYKLWTKGEEGGLKPFPEPEILISDLSPLAMELAAWGVSNPKNLPFLTQPKSSDFQTAQELLRDLGALNDNGKITALGQKISLEPTHPRLARILISGGQDANLVVALIESKDILGPNSPTDFKLRIDAMKNSISFENNNPYAINKKASSNVLKLSKRLHPKGQLELSNAQMVALAYPDRIGLSRNQNRGQFLLSGGKGAFISASDQLASAKMIVALNLDGDKREAKLRIGIEILETEFMELFHDQIKFKRICEWSKRELKVITSEEKTFQSLVLSKKKWTSCNPELIAKALLMGINDIGLDILPWTSKTKNFLARANKLNQTSDFLPNCSLEFLSKKTHEWLLPHLVGFRSKGDLEKLNMIDIIKNLFSWKQIEYLNKNAPEFILAPTGTKMIINYSEEQPKIRIRLQELFGLKTHPTIGENNEPLLVELLSPAMRIVQTTSDLPKFWLTSYSDVRRDMRGRYPRHPWPEDPMNAEPTRRIKKQNKT
ncbi:MAG: ATP-dependent helicase HrpB [Amylibacter sp.]|jgi:ATP-dependent helicase HrpB|nr:DEAD/DEAH box helicase [Rhodobacterales bacterium HTCC2255]MCO4796830.1 ATP-dependent helicase HrpB [Amylibacter sp.]MDA8800275.1 ATP-dependent helicase HrpB [Amylibacter sp.]